MKLYYSIFFDKVLLLFKYYKTRKRQTISPHSLLLSWLAVSKAFLFQCKGMHFPAHLQIFTHNSQTAMLYFIADSDIDRI